MYNTCKDNSLKRIIHSVSGFKLRTNFLCRKNGRNLNVPIRIVHSSCTFLQCACPLFLTISNCRSDTSDRSRNSLQFFTFVGVNYFMKYTHSNKHHSSEISLTCNILIVIIFALHLISVNDRFASRKKSMCCNTKYN